MTAPRKGVGLVLRGRGATGGGVAGGPGFGPTTGSRPCTGRRRRSSRRCSFPFTSLTRGARQEPHPSGARRNPVPTPRPSAPPPTRTSSAGRGDVDHVPGPRGPQEDGADGPGPAPRGLVVAVAAVTPVDVDAPRGGRRARLVDEDRSGTRPDSGRLFRERETTEERVRTLPSPVGQTRPPVGSGTRWLSTRRSPDPWGRRGVSPVVHVVSCPARNDSTGDPFTLFSSGVTVPVVHLVVDPIGVFGPKTDPERVSTPSLRFPRRTFYTDPTRRS